MVEIDFNATEIRKIRMFFIKKVFFVLNGLAQVCYEEFNLMKHCLEAIFKI